MSLALLCITMGKPYAAPFICEMGALASDLDARFVLSLDEPDIAFRPPDNAEVHVIPSDGGPMETVLDPSLEHCGDGYILRLDDDERCSPEMKAWLKARSYEESDHWAFPRRHLFGDGEHFITTPPLWPDYQTRLSVRAKSGGRHTAHAGSPYGRGSVAPGAIDHHKFLVRSLAEREALIERYDGWGNGAGTNFAMFSVPERWTEELVIESLQEETN